MTYDSEEHARRYEKPPRSRNQPASWSRYCDCCKMWIYYPCAVYPESGRHVGCGGKLLKEKPK